MRKLHKKCIFLLLAKSILYVTYHDTVTSHITTRLHNK